MNKIKVIEGKVDWNDGNCDGQYYIGDGASYDENRSNDIFDEYQGKRVKITIELLD